MIKKILICLILVTTVGCANKPDSLKIEIDTPEKLFSSALSEFKSKNYDITRNFI